MLDALGRPQDRLPPIVHVAGTNGKGSTVAFVRAMAEAAGLKGACLHLPAPGPLCRAHPPGRRPDHRRASGRGAGPGGGGQRRPGDHLLRDHRRGRLSGHGRDPGRHRGDSRWASAAGSTPQRDPARPPSRPSRRWTTTTRSSWATTSAASPGRRPAY
ncbi:MAG: hypothetical protein WDM92_10890 [Caulobacteraceae bacterium]